MKRYYLFLIALFEITLSCTSKHSKKSHVITGVVSENLYRECFQIYSGGVFANDSYSFYLTDSVHFRKYIGTVYFDDESLISKNLDSNRIVVFKTNRHDSNIEINKSIYYLDKLREEGIFE